MRKSLPLPSTSRKKLPLRSLCAGFGMALLSFLALAPVTSAQTTAPPKQYDKRFGGAGFDDVLATVPTPDGGYLLGGVSTSGVGGDKTQAGRGGYDYWAVKVNANGVKLWERRFGGDLDDVLRSIVTTPDGGFLLGGYSSSAATGDKSDTARGLDDYWIVKVDRHGKKVWDKTLGGDGNDQLFALTNTLDGGFLLAGSSESGRTGEKTDTLRGLTDYWAVKIDANGNKVWDETYGGTGSDDLRSVVVSPGGNFLLAGASDSEVGQEKTVGSRGLRDYWVVKIAANGTKIWDNRFGGSFDDLLTATAATADGGYLLVGGSDSFKDGDKTQTTFGFRDFWAVKINGSGNKVWDKAFGGTLDDQPFAVTPSEGGFLLGGTSNSGADGNKTEASRGVSDYWVVQVDANGNKKFDKRFGGDNTDVLTTLNLLADGGYVLGGYSQSGVNGDRTQSNRGASDYWVVKLRRADAAFRVNTAGYTLPTVDGRAFAADTYYGGGVYSTYANGEVSNTADDEIFRTNRHASLFNYNFPTGPGTFTVTLYFNETYFGNLVPGGVGSRRFHVNLEGQRRLTNYDAFAKAGGAMKLVKETFTVTVSDQILGVQFVSGAANVPFVSAIEVVKAPAAARLATDALPAETTLVRNLYPNPAEDRLSVTLTVPADQVRATGIVDAAGKPHLTNTHQATGENTLEVDVTALRQGLYLLRVESAGGYQTLKFIKR